MGKTRLAPRAQAEICHRGETERGQVLRVRLPAQQHAWGIKSRHPPGDAGHSVSPELVPDENDERHGRRAHGDGDRPGDGDRRSEHRERPPQRKAFPRRPVEWLADVARDEPKTELEVLVRVADHRHRTEQHERHERT